MPKKAKFKPLITRIKLNPEQAVLSCNCYSVGRRTVNVTAGPTLMCNCPLANKPGTTSLQCYASSGSSS